MALIIPTAASTYGDSSATEGGALRKYVLAQFRADADLEWVKELRAALVKEELKYRDVRDARPRLRQNRDLWGRVERGVGEASIIVIDPEPVEAEIREYVRAQRMTEGQDFDPRAVTEACATAIIAGTPLAYLPLNLARTVPWGLYDPVADLDAFTPESIKSAVGSGPRRFGDRPVVGCNHVGRLQVASSTGD